MRSKIMLLILMLLIAQSTAASSIDKPWNDYIWVKSNPYIHDQSGTELWNVRAMQGSLDNLSLNEIETGDSTVDTVLGHAKESYWKATESRDKCENGLYGVIVNILKKLFLNTVSGFFDLMEIAINDGDWRTLVSSCISYGGEWKNTMDYSVDALEKSIEKKNDAELKANESYQRLLATGLCNDDYAGGEKAMCENIENDYFELRKKNEELKETLGNFGNGLRKYAPETNEYKNIMNLIWDAGGIIEKSEDIHTKSKKTVDEGRGTYQIHEVEVGNNAKIADFKIAELKKQKLEKITEAPRIGKYIESSKETVISQRLEILKRKQMQMNELIENASFYYRSSQMPGYMKNAINSLKQAKKIADEISRDADRLTSDADAIAGDAKKEAEDELAKMDEAAKGKVLSKEIQERIEDTRKALEKADSTSALGDRYYDYKETARKARITVGLIDKFDAGLEAETNAKLADLAKLLNNAEKDGIDVSLEKAEFDLIRGMSSPAEFITNLESIKDNVIEKAQIKYSHLEKDRKELMEAVSLVPGVYSIEEIRQEEGDAISEDGKLEYSRAIGRLKELDEYYSEAKSNFDSKKNEIIANGIEKEVDAFIEEAELDKETDVTIAVYLKNRYAAQGEQIKTSVDLPVNIALTKSDITEGSDRVQEIIQKGKKLDIIMKQVESFEGIMVKFEKKKVVASTTGKKITAVGNGDGSADITEDIKFEMELDSKIKKPDRFDGIEIDGLEYSTGKLNEGTHTMIGNYEIADAYAASTENYRTTKIGFNSNVNYDVVFNASIDLDSTPFFMSEKTNEKIKNFNIIPLTGERITNKQLLDNGEYRFDITGLKKGKTAKVRVSYLIENASGYASEKLKSFEGLKLSDEVQKLVDDARRELNNNNTEKAIAKLEEAQNKLEKEQAEKGKNERTYEKLLDDAGDREKSLEQAVEKARNAQVKDVFIDIIEKRKDDLDAKINESKEKKDAGNWDDAIDDLKGIDMGWEKTRIKEKKKDIFDKYNKLKEDLVKSGEEAPQEFADFENAFSKLEATNDIEDLVDALAAFESAKAKADELKEHIGSEAAELRQLFESLKKDMKQVLDKYSKLQKSAKGGKFEFMFPFDAKEIEKDIKDVEALINGNGNLELETSKVEDISDKKKQISNILATLKKQSEDKLNSINAIFAERQASMSEVDRKKISDDIVKLKELAQNGDYIDALKLSELVLKNLQNSQGRNDSLLIVLGVATVVVLGGIAFFIMREKGIAGLDKLKIGEKKEEKSFRKLERVKE